MDTTKLSSYDFDLPKELIADRPAQGRHNSKLLVYKISTNEIFHDHYINIDKYLPDNSLITFNRSKVFSCRINGKKLTGGKCEIFILSLIPDNHKNYEVLIKTSGKKNINDQFFFDGGLIAKITSIEEGFFKVSLNMAGDKLQQFLEEYGSIPIPPYIRNGIADERDYEDYQTLFAKEAGSVAAPTAGLHFTPEIFDKLEKRGIEKAFVTLHVGMGTFLPVKTESILEHKMHSEKFFVDEENLKKLQAKKNIFCVGTTSLRVLESSFNNDSKQFDLNPNEMNETDIFLYPGKEIHSIKGLITNFHLPGSTLLMLVSTLTGRDKAIELYELAIKEKYRFFSYGDGMLIIK